MRVATGVIVTLFLGSLLSASGVGTARPVEPTPLLLNSGDSRVQVTFGAMTIEIVRQPNGYDFVYFQSGSEYRFSIIDDSEGTRYSINGGLWRGAPLEPKESYPMMEASSYNPDKDPDFHFRLNYWWDGVRFIRGYPAVYPHPDRGYHHVVSKNDWRYWGIQLLHFQLGTDNVGLSLNFGPYVVGALIGGLIGSLVGGPLGTVVGTILGAVVGGLLAYYYNVRFVDEAGALWWWINKSFFTAIKNIPWWFWFCGRCVEGYIASHIDFLRVGSLTAINDLRIRGP